jgi:hypothetical protein
MTRIIFAVVLALALVAVPVAAQDAEQQPTLAVDYLCSTYTERVQVHLTFTDIPPVPGGLGDTVVVLLMRLDGGEPTYYPAPFVRFDDGEAAYRADVPGYPAEAEVITGTLTIDKTTYHITNPGMFKVPSCTGAPSDNPTAVTLASFDAGATPRCKLTGNGKSKACVCNVGGRWRGAPMGLCR